MNRTIEYLITEKKTDSGLNNSYEGKDIPVRILPKSNVCQKHTGKWCPLLYAPDTDCRRHSKSHYL